MTRPRNRKTRKPRPTTAERHDRQVERTRIRVAKDFSTNELRRGRIAKLQSDKLLMRQQMRDLRRQLRGASIEIKALEAALIGPKENNLPNAVFVEMRTV